MGTTNISPSLRRLVHDRARGLCEYCLTPETAQFTPYEVDHIIALKHEGATTLENLAFCCARCNKHKGSDIASIDQRTGEIVSLFNPRRDNWAEHFQVDDAQIVPLTAIAHVTVQLLQLNHPNRMAEREELIAGGLYQVPTVSQ